MALIAAELEGIITSRAANGTGATLVVMGVRVDIDKEVADNRRIKTPTAKLTIAQLLDDAKLPGRAEDGFDGGTAIVTGNYNTLTGIVEVKFRPTIPGNQGDAPFEENPLVEIGPPENVLAGPITQNDGGGLTVNKVKVTRLGAGDARLPGDPMENDFGFEVVPTSVGLDVPASVEGYFSTVDNAFIGFNFVIDGPATLANAAPQVSITRAQGRNRGAEYDVDLRGGVTTAHAVGGLPQRLEILRVDDGVGETLLGTASAPLIPGGFSKWRFSERLTALAPPLDTAPTRVRVRNVSPGAGGATAEEEDVEIIKG